MLADIIKKISNEFIKEATNSPKLLEDLAMMEKYISESYNQRILIELLQNADDAQSKTAKLFFDGTNLYFANDGRPFNEHDVISISRSGASNKERGSTIGYRGIGFKSTSFLSEKIIIKSDNIYFTFSKERCAEILGKSKSEVPTIRIPFFVEEAEIDAKIIENCDELESQGFSTIFVFENAKISLILEEIDLIHNGYFLFLKNLSKFILDVYPKKDEYKILRNKSFDRHVSLFGNLLSINSKGGDEKWFIVSKNRAELAFKVQDNHIIEADNQESTFHAFLPTCEKVGFSFKINGDFSTDPSRKQIIFDDKSKEIIEDAADILVSIFEKVFDNESYAKFFGNLILIYNNQIAFSRISRYLKECLEMKLKENLYVTLGSNEKIPITNFKDYPKWLENSEFNILKETSQYCRNISLKEFVYKNVYGIHDFIYRMSCFNWDIFDIMNILIEKDFVSDVDMSLLGLLYGNLINDLYYVRDENPQISLVKECYIRYKKSVVLLSNHDIKWKPDSFSSDFITRVKDIASRRAIEWFDRVYNTNFSNVIFFQYSLNDDVYGSSTLSLFNYETEDMVEPTLNQQNNYELDGLGISVKWKSAEQICCEIENKLGNDVQNVSKQNLGYDLISVTKEGKKRYIEVKSGKDSFTLTNNEYSSANLLAEEYYICLINQTGSEIKAIYINNPIKNLKIEKRVKQWEWFCDEIKGEEMTFQIKD